MISRRTALTALAAAAVAPLVPGLASAQSLGAGTFVGASNHITTGSARIFVLDGITYVQLGEDFTFDGAPDPKVALGADGYDKDTLLAPLAKNTGSQNYEIPASIDASAYNEVWIWCEQFNVPLGVAKLSS